MAIITHNSPYADQVLEQLLTNAATGNELVAGGHIHVVPDVTTKLAIPRIKAGGMLQKVKEMPGDGDSKGDFTVDDRHLEPQEFMAFTTFNPSGFKTLWREFQPTGPLVFAELPQAAQNALLAALNKSVQFELGDHYVNGEFGAGENQLFNGVLYRIANDTDTVSIPTPVAITQENVVSKLEAVRTKIPVAIRANPKLKIYMSWEDWDLYDKALTAREHKGKDETSTNAKLYKGIPIVTLAAWPKDVMVSTIGSKDEDSNMWAGIGFSDDEDVILIDKLTNAGERYFFKMKLKCDTQIVWGENTIFYDARS